MNEAQRKAIYAFVTALIPVGIVYGLLTQEQAAVIAPAVLAAFSLVMAYRNVPEPPGKGDVDPGDGSDATDDGSERNQ